MHPGSGSGHSERHKLSSQAVPFLTTWTYQERVLHIDVLVSTLSRPPSTQVLLADAAKAAGIKLFFPSEFGSDMTKVENPQGYVVEMVNLQEKLRNLGLPYVLVLTGLWPEDCLSP